MEIHIPGDAEPLLKRNAALAGFDDVREYVLNLILNDDPQEPAHMPDSNDPRILQAIDDGYASGVAGDANDIIPELREAIQRRNGSRSSNSN